MRAISLMFLFFPALATATEPDNYLVLFTADHVPYKPSSAHTFAAVARVAIQPDGGPCLIDLVSISWLPETMKVRPFALRPEKGRNVPLHETLQHFQGKNSHIRAWGPYLIQPELAEIFRERAVTVESCFKYKGACLTSPRYVCDCARSIEESIEQRRRYIGVYGYGAAAGSVIVQKMSPWIVRPEQCTTWVATLMGLDGYALDYQPFGCYYTKRDQMKASR